jgi:SNF2 family DNA or RNA helicase
VDELADFVECNPKPLVVAAEYREIIELAYARLTSMGIKCGLITGKQTIDERHVTCQEFQKGKLQVVLMTLGAGGVGITLTAADTIYFIERSSSMLANTQGEDRVYRIGSEIHDAVRVVVCIAQDSIEDNREYQLAIKADRFEEVIQDKERARRMLNANGK